MGANPGQDASWLSPAREEARCKPGTAQVPAGTGKAIWGTGYLGPVLSSKGGREVVSGLLPPTMWHLLGMGVPGRHPSLLVAGVFAVGKGPAGEGG